jgi:hypothetical protein
MTKTKMNSALEQLIKDARKKSKDASGCADMGGLEMLGRVMAGAWSLMLGIHRHDGIEHWHFSAMLFPKGRSSTEQDWEDLGYLIAGVVGRSGYPTNGPDVHPLTPFETTNPNSVHHWAWHTDGTPLDPAALQALKEMMSAISSAGSPMSSNTAEAFPAVDRLIELLQRVGNAEASLMVVARGGKDIDKHLSKGLHGLEGAAHHAREHGHDDVASSLEDLHPIFNKDAKRACALLREVRISVRLQLDAATEAAGLPRVPPASVVTQGPHRAQPKVGRNAPCPCGSGKKYKKCCGAAGNSQAE